MSKAISVETKMNKAISVISVETAEKQAIKWLNFEAKSAKEAFATVVDLALASGKSEDQFQTSCDAVNKKLSPDAKKSFKVYKSTVLWAIKNKPEALERGVTKRELEDLRKDALAQATDADGSSTDAPKVTGLIIDGKAMGIGDLSPEVVTFAKDLQVLLNNLSSNDARQELLTHAKAAIAIWLKHHQQQQQEAQKQKIKQAS